MPPMKKRPPPPDLRRACGGHADGTFCLLCGMTKADLRARFMAKLSDVERAKMERIEAEIGRQLDWLDPEDVEILD